MTNFWGRREKFNSLSRKISGFWPGVEKTFEGDGKSFDKLLGVAKKNSMHFRRESADMGQILAGGFWQTFWGQKIGRGVKKLYELLRGMKKILTNKS